MPQWPFTALETIDPLQMNEIQGWYQPAANGQLQLVRRSGRY
jgi:hypothetical protein